MLKPSDIYRQRRSRLRDRYNRGLLVIIRGDAPFCENLYYLSGLETYHSALVLDLATGNETVFVWDLQYGEGRSQTDVTDLRNIKNVASVLDDVIQWSPTEMYVEINGEGISACYAELYHCLPNCRILDASNVVANLRMLKDPWEIHCLMESQDRAKAIVADVIALLEDGITERDVAAEIVRHMICKGSSRPELPIVAFGENTLSTHHNASNRRLRAGDLVLIDVFGELCNHYCAEVTETICFRGGSQEAHKRIEAVNGVHAELEQYVRPGITLEHLDELAGRMLHSIGMGEEYLGSCSHDVGLCEHDPTDKMTPLAPGRVIAIEPGLYSKRHNLGVRKERVLAV